MYAGMAKLLRLLHIASRCRSLRVDALRLALNHVQTTHNVSMYRSIHTQLVEAINKYVFCSMPFCMVAKENNGPLVILLVTLPNADQCSKLFQCEP